VYNKIFTKILDSSIWLAPDPHRIVWITLLAAMDEDGNAMFASTANLAARARVTREQAASAIRAFESPDPDSGDPDNEGRRVERFPGGWHILNAAKYRSIVTKEIARERTRERVAKWRERKREVTQGNAGVTPSNAAKRKRDASVTPSEARAISTAEDQELSDASRPHPGAIAGAIPAGESVQAFTDPTSGVRAVARAMVKAADPPDDLAAGFTEFWTAYPRKEAKRDALKVWKARRIGTNPYLIQRIVSDVQERAAHHRPWLDGFTPHAPTYLRGERWTDAIDRSRPKTRIASAQDIAGDLLDQARADRAAVTNLLLTDERSEP
jgi:hypothetical protein